MPQGSNEQAHSPVRMPADLASALERLSTDEDRTLSAELHRIPAARDEERDRIGKAA